MPRHAEPTALKILKGNPGKRALNRQEPVPAGSPVMPKTLTKAARPIWTRLLGAMPPGVWTTAEEHLLAAYCEAVVMWQKATATIEAEGMTSHGANNQLMVSPYVKIQSDNARLMTQLGQRLGLDPSSRASLKAEFSEPQKDDTFGLIQ